MQQSKATKLMADVLPGYTWSHEAGRYRSSATGQFVARRRIAELLDAQINSASARYAELTTAFYEGRVSSTVWVEQMRTEQRRLTLQNEALGAGGWDRLGPTQWGRAGRDLRDQYAKIAGTAQDIVDGKITLAQALARANEYAGATRAHFYQAESETVQRSASNMIVIERRVLGSGGKTCKDCVEFYEMGWQIMGVLPPPCKDSICGGNCKCHVLRKEVPATEVNEWIGTKR